MKIIVKSVMLILSPSEKLKKPRFTFTVSKPTLRSLKKKFFIREAERTAQEKKNLQYGIMFLGSLVSTLIAIIWAYRSEIFK